MFCLKFLMALTKSSESPLQNELKIFVDDQKLKKSGKYGPWKKLSKKGRESSVR